VFFIYIVGVTSSPHGELVFLERPAKTGI